MISEKQTKKIVLYSRWELILLALLPIPNIFVFLIVPHSQRSLSELALTDGPPNLGQVIIYYVFLSAILAGLLVALGYVFEAVRSRHAPKGIIPPTSITLPLEQTLRSVIGNDLVSALISRIQLVPRDLSLGAHVQGILSQRIVISGGMIPALLGNEERALTILFHEYGHIRNWDKFLPGIVVYSLINCIFYIIAFKIVGVVIAVLIYGTTSYVCRRREFYADAYSAALVNSKVPLVNTLDAAEKCDRTFFHPSLVERINAAGNGFPVMKPSFLWFGIWIMFMFVGLFVFPSFATTLVNFDYPNPTFMFAFGPVDEQQLSYLLPFVSIGSACLILTAASGIIVEVSKYFGTPFAKP
jgi:Peptidase family M48